MSGIGPVEQAGSSGTAQAPPRPLGPIAEGERVELIDIVRGLALFGILAFLAGATVLGKVPL